MFDDDFLILLWLVEALTHHDIRTQPKCQPNDETDTNLAYNLVFTLQTLLVALEDLDIVIEESEESQPDRGDDHQQQISIT